MSDILPKQTFTKTFLQEKTTSQQNKKAVYRIGVGFCKLKKPNDNKHQRRCGKREHS
jgi:hypothetical protein